MVGFRSEALRQFRWKEDKSVQVENSHEERMKKKIPKKEENLKNQDCGNANTIAVEI